MVVLRRRVNLAGTRKLFFLFFSAEGKRIMRQTRFVAFVRFSPVVFSFHQVKIFGRRPEGYGDTIKNRGSISASHPLWFAPAFWLILEKYDANVPIAC